MIRIEVDYKISSDLAAIIKDRIKGYILDVGTGDGSKLYHLLEGSKFKKAVALEPDSSKIDSAKKLFKKDARVKLINTDLKHMPRQIGQFDLVMMFEVIEHIPLALLDGYIRRIRGLLVKGGIIIVSSPNRYIYRMICNLKLEKRESTHVSEMNWLELRRFMKNYFKEQVFKGEFPGMSITRRFPVFYNYFSLLNKNFAHPAVSRAIYWVGEK
ncbi:MAG: class I SAM-dependent methyltransferase [Candidatus Kaelpia imicola]|nr:class I SAM-dependent methyltransferase [Candidatus Kaelpia imicola]